MSSGVGFVYPPFPGGNAPDIVGVPIEPPPFSTPPRGCVAVDAIYQGVVFSEGSFGTATDLDPVTGRLIDVPNNWQLRLAGLGFGAVSPIGTVFATWTILANNNPLAAYSNLPCAVGTVDQPANVTVQVPGPATIRLQVSNHFLTAQSFIYTARFLGWLYQEARPR